MTVYVDKTRNKYGRMIMCHMVADTVEELHQMAAKLGLKRRWFQTSNSGIPHYDISLTKRASALEFGAKEISRNRLVSFMKKYAKNRKPVKTVLSFEGEDLVMKEL